MTSTRETGYLSDTTGGELCGLASPRIRPPNGSLGRSAKRAAGIQRLLIWFVIGTGVVIRRIEGEEKTKGGIIIPDNAKEKPQEGEVIAVGPGARDESGKVVPLDLKASDRVLFSKWSGTEVKIDGEDLLIMKESDIMGVIEGAPALKKKAA